MEWEQGNSQEAPDLHVLPEATQNLAVLQQPPLFAHTLAAGFPSPADDYVERRLDLNDYCVDRPEATFFFRVKGLSMIGAGIFEGDILVVDRSITAASGKVVVAVLDGEFTVKRLQLPRMGTTEPVQLLPENPEFSPIVVQEGQDLAIWGVARHVIHTL
jgi:DNA polymerase V